MPDRIAYLICLAMLCAGFVMAAYTVALILYLLLASI